jgi:dienelactone hydrolase
MGEVLLFHHARTFPSIDEGMAYAQELGFPDEIVARGERAAGELPNGLVDAGFSLGVLPAQKLAQTRAGARGALLFYSCVPTEYFGFWPAGLPVQIHGMDAHPIFVDEGDIDAARELVASTDRGELYLYPGDQHYFADSSLPSYDAEATALLSRRVLDFLRRVGD